MDRKWLDLAIQAQVPRSSLHKDVASLGGGRVTIFFTESTRKGPIQGHRDFKMQRIQASQAPEPLSQIHQG